MCTLKGVDARIISTRLLANGMPPKFRQTQGQIDIEIPESAPGADVSVVALNPLQTKDPDVFRTVASMRHLFPRRVSLGLLRDFFLCDE